MSPRRITAALVGGVCFLLGGDTAAQIEAIVADLDARPLEMFKGAAESLQVGDHTSVTSVAGDAMLTFVVVHPRYRQTPNIVIYRSVEGGSLERLPEAMAAGRLVPLSGKLGNAHPLGLGMDLVAGDGTKGPDRRVASLALAQGMFAAQYESFMHVDMRDGPPGFVDLTRVTMPDGSDTCEAFEFEPVERLVGGTINGMSAVVALTPTTVTMIIVERVDDQGFLEKRIVDLKRPTDPADIQVTVDGGVAYFTRVGIVKPLAWTTGR